MRLGGSFASEAWRVIMVGPRYVNSQRCQRFLLALAVSGLVFGPGSAAQAADRTGFAILVFSKATDFRHDSIPDGIAAIRTLGAEHGFTVDATEDATTFTVAALARFRAVMFLSTTGDVLDPEQKTAFEYIRGRLVGAYFASHPQIQATVHTRTLAILPPKGLPAIWERTERVVQLPVPTREAKSMSWRLHVFRRQDGR